MRHAILNVRNVRLPPLTAVPVQQMERMKLFWTEVPASINFRVQLELMVNHQPMSAKHAIQAVLPVRGIKTTVQLALETCLSYQISVMLIVLQDISNHLVYV